MLYDVFISHASEDKEELVRPLAEALRKYGVEVWYDEFQLKLGDSLRQSIDHGLAKSRYGVVILSQNFFQKGWPEWELDGLVQRQVGSSRSLILPVWHGVTKQTVEKYSPSLANIVAIKSENGIPSVVEAIIKVLWPQGSALLIARDILLNRGYNPPVVTDDWWLDVLEFSAIQDNRRWFFPVWEFISETAHRGERLAWFAMQMQWQDEAEINEISQITPPEKVLQFIESQPGLIDACKRMPDRLAAYAPQLLLTGSCGRFAAQLDKLKSQIEAPQKQEALNDGHNYKAHSAACRFCQWLPQAEVYDKIDYIAWFLSSQSSWLPKHHHDFLFEGMKVWAAWVHWMPPCRFAGFENEPQDDSHTFFMTLAEANTVDDLRANLKATAELTARLKVSRIVLGLPESEATLTERFLACGIVDEWIRQKVRPKAKSK